MGKSRIIISGLLAMVILSGCAGNENLPEQGQIKEEESAETVVNSAEIQAEDGTGVFGESAEDGQIDFALLQEKNQDIFAWLYVPGTDIDTPVLQSPVSDDYYKFHDVEGRENDRGALYTEMPNLMNMCDFNTIIHGNDILEEGDFHELHSFENPDFFETHREFYIYLPDNVLTYEIFAAFYDEGSDILRRHDYTTYKGCQDYLDALKTEKSMGRNMQEGWEDVTPYHFLVTLDGVTRDDGGSHGGEQYVVIGILTGDAAGKINRIIYD
ncbi:MAG: class B sortase [Clostridium sp.]|nr:class B sortase [Clostridium sp.]